MISMTTSDDHDDVVAVPKESLSDEVIHLREWGTNRIHLLPRAPFPACFVRTFEASALQLTDLPACPGHLRLIHDRRHWRIQDLGSGVGLRQDGAPREEFALDPGVEIGIGRTTLIAESARSIALRAARGLGLRSEDETLKVWDPATGRRSPRFEATPAG
jgi:hypothetical protein